MSPSSKSCVNCGSDLSCQPPSARICRYCGHELPKQDPLPNLLPPPPKKPETESLPPASLQVRTVATLIDLLVLVGFFALIRNIWAALFVCWTYATLMECSEDQATSGKRYQGLKVTDLEGERISLGRAAARNLVKFGSLLIACAASLFTARKQGLHDLIAGTLVEVSRKPRIVLPPEIRSRLRKLLYNKTKN